MGMNTEQVADYNRQDAEVSYRLYEQLRQREALFVRENRCPACATPLGGLISCWNPGCSASVHALQATWPAATTIIVTTGEAVR